LVRPRVICLLCVCCAARRVLLSFPTRRSSDLAIKGGKLPVTLDGDVVIGADAELGGAIRVRHGVEIGESAQVDGPSGYPEDVVTELDDGCEVLDRARIHSGARLGRQTCIGSSADVGAQVVTGVATDIGDHAADGDCARINGSGISDHARIGDGVETGHAADVGEWAVIEDNAVIETYARVEDDCYVRRGQIVSDTVS